MGLHICEWCKEEHRLGQAEQMEYGPSSSADVALICTISGTEWVFPWIGLPHYVKEHGYQPPLEFITAVMNGTLKEGDYYQTKGIKMQIGSLKHPDIQRGAVPKDFLARLHAIVEEVKKQQYLGTSSGFVQYRGGTHQVEILNSQQLSTK